MSCDTPSFFRIEGLRLLGQDHVLPRLESEGLLSLDSHSLTAEAVVLASVLVDGEVHYLLLS